MAIRGIVTDGDPVLHKKCRPVERFDTKLAELLDDMAETMYEANGVGLAAPQVGILRRVAVIDVGEGLLEFINPVILKTSGEATESEGCLSFPGEYGLVTRPTKVTVGAYDRTGKYFELTGRDLLARAICHETDHLDGRVFKDLAVQMLPKDSL